MPAQPCMSTTAGNGPAPSGRSSHAATASGLPGVALGNDRFVEAQPVTTIEARSTDSARRSMVRAYTAPQRAAKLEALRRADAYKAGLGRRDRAPRRDHDATGKRMRRVAPQPAALSTDIWPPWFSTTAREMASPRPKPPLSLALATRPR